MSVFDKIYRIVFENDQAIEQNKAVEKSLNSVGTAAKEAGSKVEEYGKKTDEAAKSSEEFAEAAKAIGGEIAIAAAAVTAAIYSVKKLSEEYDRQTSILGAFSGSVDEASKRVSGLVSKMDLMVLSNKASESGLQLTEQQLGTITVAALKFADATGGSAAEAMDGLIQAVAVGEEGYLKKLGVSLQGATNLAQKQSMAIAQLEGKYGALSYSGDTLADVFPAIGSGMSDLVTAFNKGTMASRDAGLGGAIRTLGLIFGEAAKSAENAGNKFSKFVDNVSAGYGVLGKLTGIRSIESIKGKGPPGTSEAEIQAELAKVMAAAEGQAREVFRVSEELRKKREAAKNAKGPKRDVFSRPGRDGAQFDPLYDQLSTGMQFASVVKSQNAEEDKARNEAFDARNLKQRGGNESGLEGPAKALGRSKKEIEELIRAHEALIDSQTEVALSASGMADAYGSSVEAFASGQATIGQAAKMMFATILKNLGHRAIAEGSFDMLKGLAMSLQFMPNGPALIGTGAAELALGTALIAGGANVSPSASKPSSSSAGSTPARGDVVRQRQPDKVQGNGGTLNVYFDTPVPEDQIGRMQDRASRAFARRTGRT